MLCSADDPLAAAAHHVKEAVQHHDHKHVRRIKTFRDELPAPFNEYDHIDPGLAIFVPVDDPGAAAVVKKLEAIRILHKL